MDKIVIRGVPSEKLVEIGWYSEKILEKEKVDIIIFPKDYIIAISADNMVHQACLPNRISFKEAILDLKKIGCFV